MAMHEVHTSPCQREVLLIFRRLRRAGVVVVPEVHSVRALGKVPFVVVAVVLRLVLLTVQRREFLAARYVSCVSCVPGGHCGVHELQTALQPVRAALRKLERGQHALSSHRATVAARLQRG